MSNILYLVATDLEYNILREFHEGDFLVTGIGQVNTTMSLTQYLSTHDMKVVVHLGIGGVGNDDQTSLGELVLASEEWFADLGVETPVGMQGLEEIGIPLIPEQPKPWNRVQVCDKLTDQISKKMNIKTLPFLTVNSCTGTYHRLPLIGESTSPFIENMEGAAAAFVCQKFSVQYIEIRAISNRVGLRNKADWMISEALQNLGQKMPENHQTILESLND